MLRKNALACILTEKTHHFKPQKECMLNTVNVKSKQSAKIPDDMNLSICLCLAN